VQNPSQVPGSNSQQPINYQIDDDTDEFNNHLQMLLNSNRLNPAPVLVPRNDSVNYGQDSSNPRHLSGVRQPHRQATSESVDQWLRQSLSSRDNNIQGQSHELNRSHASHVSSQQDDLIGQMGMAVPIRPPQQHESFISHPGSENPPPSSSQYPGKISKMEENYIVFQHFILSVIWTLLFFFDLTE
jgi:hypothetical protein